MRGHAMARPGKTKQLQVSVPKLVHDKLKGRHHGTHRAGPMNAPYPHPTERNGLNQEGNEGRTRDCRREEGSLTKNPAGGERG